VAATHVLADFDRTFAKAEALRWRDNYRGPIDLASLKEQLSIQKLAD